MSNRTGLLLHGWMSMVVVLALTIIPAACAQGAAIDAPWWKKEKICFMWGAWGHSAPESDVLAIRRPVPRDVFQKIALAGATVFADRDEQRYVPRHARLAKEFGLRYFVGARSRDPLWYTTGREWVSKHGEHEVRDEKFKFKCPRDEVVLERWLIEPFIAGIREGLVDGFVIDWEAGGLPMTFCYCDHCFAKFPAFAKSGEQLPDKTERFRWLEGRGLVQPWKEHFSTELITVLRRVRDKLRAANPQLLFAQYPLYDEFVGLDFCQAMHTPDTPYIFLDARHYTNDDRQPWWESYGRRLQQEGYLYIPGSWTNAIFGAQPSQISAARWIYEASINFDGNWIWFEHELTEEMLRAYSTADRAIRAVMHKVGPFLQYGRRDPNFVTVVEWTGRPNLERAVFHQTYHLDDQHLAHLSNVDSDWPLRARIRFPRLAEGRQWLVRDVMSDQYYARDGESAMWTSAQLRAGVVVAMEARSDQFLLIAPGNSTVEVDAARLMPSREFSVLPCHAESSAQADATADESAGAMGDHPAERIVYTATEPMRKGHYAGVRSIISNAIRSIDLNGENDTRLRHLRGHLWSPTVSPDGKNIAFVHNAHSRGQIFVMDADGSNAVDVSNNDFCDRAPVWNPHDGRIAFVSDRTGDWDIYAMNPDGSDQRLMAGNPGLDRTPVWSPDGTQLAWESHTSGSSDIWIRVAGESRPLVAPGRHVKFRMARDWVNPPLIVDLEPIFPDNTSYLWHPVWSPDGKHIAAGTIHHLAGDTPAVLAADGSSVLQLVYAYTGIDHLTWSPDGRWLAGTWRCAPQETERSGVFVIKSDGTDHEKRGYWVVDVTPQGPRLGGAARAGLTTWYSHGSARPRRVVKTFTSLAWSPDGKTLAFSSDMDPSGAFYVYTISTEGGQPRRLDRTMSAWPNDIMWMPRNN